MDGIDRIMGLKGQDGPSHEHFPDPGNPVYPVKETPRPVHVCVLRLFVVSAFTRAPTAGDGCS
jgi:hypothetical protein